MRWKKQSDVTGYEVWSSTKSFSSKQHTVKKVSGSATSCDVKSYDEIRKMKSRRFYVKIRAYKKVGKKTYYGKWKTLKILY